MNSTSSQSLFLYEILIFALIVFLLILSFILCHGNIYHHSDIFFFV
ncbi:MAG: hypothetical protein Q8S84_07505 [bacterium]|nr:hypothetical protein [bacterium]